MGPCCFESCQCRLRHRRHGVIFHEFPKLEEIRAKWVAVVRSERREPRWSPTAASRVCSLHFARAHYLSRKVLHARAVPTASYEIPKYMSGYKKPSETQVPAETIDLDNDIPDDPFEFPDVDEPEDVSLDFDDDELMELATGGALDLPLETADKPAEAANKEAGTADKAVEFADKEAGAAEKETGAANENTKAVDKKAGGAAKEVVAADKEAETAIKPGEPTDKATEAADKMGEAANKPAVPTEPGLSGSEAAPADEPPVSAAADNAADQQPNQPLKE